MEAPSFSTGAITTSDGITIRFISAGQNSSPTLLFIPGWSQTAIQWRKQLSYFSQKYRVLAIDHRGHGDSDKPDGGYRISRLAADLNELITQLDLKNITIISHSMGCSVFWAYWSTYADSRARVSRCVLVDQAATITADPTWEEGYAKSVAAVFSPSSAFELAAGLSGADGSTVTKNFVQSMFTDRISEDDLAWTLEQCVKMSSKNAGTLLINHANQNWSDVFPSITIPTLVIGGEASLFPSEGIEWLSKQIPNSRCRIFKKEEGGSHFMFWENDKEFNRLLDEFFAE